MGCKYKYNNTWYSKEELKSILLKERGILPDGKLVKPDVKKEIISNKWAAIDTGDRKSIKEFDTKEEAEKWIEENKEEAESLGLYLELGNNTIIGKQPTQTRENTISIESVKDKIVRNTDRFVLQKHDTRFVIYDQIEQDALDIFDNEKDAKEAILKLTNQEGLKEKEYTQQALTNLKIAALKEVARKYPRSLITSKVVPINPNIVDNSEIQYSKVENIQDLQNEINQLKQELERVEREGFGALRPIYNSYENTVAKLNKQLNEKLKAILQSIGVRYEAVDSIYNAQGEKVDAIGVAKVFENLIQIVEGKQSNDTLAEETAHMIIEMLGPNHTLYQAMFNSITGFDIYKDVVTQYSEVYKGDTNLLKKEAMGKLVAQMIVNNFENQRAENLWQRILRWLAAKLGMITPEQKNAFEELAEKILKGDLNDLSASTSEDELFQMNTSNESPFQKQIVSIKRRIATLEQAIKDTTPEHPLYASRVAELDQLQELLNAELEEGVDQDQIFLKAGTIFLNNLEQRIDNLDNLNPEIVASLIDNAFNLLDTWAELPALSGRVADLRGKLFPLTKGLIEDTVNEFATEKKRITWEDITSQNTDIDSIRMGTGALSDVDNYLARTIGSVIKVQQNTTTANNVSFANKLNDKLNAIMQWGKSQGLTEEQVFDLFIEEKYETLTLVQKKIPSLNGYKLNPKYELISRTPALLDFYEFYKESIQEINNQVPEKVGISFIPNIKKSNFEWNPKKWVKSKTFYFDSFVGREDLFADTIPGRKYTNKLKPEEKSRHLGEALLKMKMYANEYETMAKALPKIRILQEHLAFKYTDSLQKPVVDRVFKSSSDPSKEILGKNTNLYHMVDKYIDMQVKGITKLNQGKIFSTPIYNEAGNQVGETYLHASDLADQLLKWNSLVRIGLSPITATSNAIFGDISNFLEGVGGRFYTVGNLHNATKIFMTQKFKEDSVLNRLLMIVNPLQELDDYEQVSKVRVKRKVDSAVIKEKMYSMQKIGEVYLQSRTMLAVMIHDGYLTSDGELTEAGTKLLSSAREVEKLRDKIQRLNDMIHGRYSSRDAAIWSQNIWYRMVFQFRKWIPAAYENRMGKHQWDNRLGAEFEGRYRVMKRLLLNLSDTKKRIAEGNLTELELYSIKKQLAEVFMIVGSVSLYMLLLGGDDDKKRRKDPVVKALLTLTSRASQDLLFWTDPSNFTEMASKSVPVASLVDDAIDAVLALPYAFYVGDWEHKTGSKKGQNKFYSELRKITPVGKPVGDLMRVFNDRDLEEFR